MIWLIGNKGMLGSDIESELKKNKLNYIASDCEVDITDIDKIKDFINGKKISWIINAAAYTDVDGAESDKEKVYLINAEAVKNLAEIGGMSDIGNIKLIHISTDYVFNGMSAACGAQNKPYKEYDLTLPQNVYGKSKLKGENYLKESGQNVRCFIIELHGFTEKTEGILQRPS